MSATQDEQRETAKAVLALIEEARPAYAIPVDCADPRSRFVVGGYFIVPVTACLKSPDVVLAG